MLSYPAARERADRGRELRDDADGANVHPLRREAHAAITQDQTKRTSVRGSSAVHLAEDFADEDKKVREKIEARNGSQEVKCIR